MEIPILLSFLVQCALVTVKRRPHKPADVYGMAYFETARTVMKQRAPEVHFPLRRN